LIKNWRYEKFLLKLEVSSHTAGLNFQYCLVNLDISYPTPLATLFKEVTTGKRVFSPKEITLSISISF
jgi:hypothetical protein